MVNTEVPIDYIVQSTPNNAASQLTINHEATVDLDSSNAFEGPEKLLEVWFGASADVLPIPASSKGLKAVPAETWKEMLDLVHCKVLSVIESEHVDAYLLSESSMFVFPHKLILKTCGTTTLLLGLPRILEIARTVAGFPNVAGDLDTGLANSATPYRVFYSRKNFLFPERQVGPHRSWRDEVKTLDSLFRGGSAYMIGKMNGEHWYLYLTEPNTLLTPPTTPPPMETKIHHLDIPADQAEKLCRGSLDDCREDETLEILMTDLDQDNAKQFYLDHASNLAESQFFERVRDGGKDNQDSFGSLQDSGIAMSGEHAKGVFEKPLDSASASQEAGLIPAELTTEGHALGTVVSDASGLTNLYPVARYPEARIDAYLFTPCGFSANGVIPTPEGHGTTHYFTVHVTPEAICSYASFETNVPCKQTGRETVELIEQVVGIFKPGRFSVTLFEAKQVLDDAMTEVKDMEKVRNAKGLRMDNIRGYRRVERIVHDLEGYDLVFRYYERHGFEGGEPRIGEVY